MKITQYLIVSLFALVLLSGCKLQSDDDIILTTSDDFTSNAFEVEVEILDSFGQPVSLVSSNEAVSLRLSVTNLQDEVITITFHNSQRVKAVFTQNDELVYDFDSRFSYLAVIGEEEFIPNDTKTFNVALNSSDFPSGDIQITASIALADLSNETLLDETLTQFEAQTTIEVLP